MSEKENEAVLVHPMVTKLVQTTQAIETYLATGKYVSALDRMELMMVGTFKPEDQDDELLKKINQARNRIRHAYSQGQRQGVRHTTTSHGYYVKLYRTLNNKAHAAGYFSNEKYGGFYDPSGGKKSDKR